MIQQAYAAQVVLHVQRQEPNIYSVYMHLIHIFKKMLNDMCPTNSK